MTPRIRRYADEVGFWHGVGVRDIMSKGRGQKHISMARGDLMRRLHHKGFSLAQIGRWMDRDHTTVLYHVRASK